MISVGRSFMYFGDGPFSPRYVPSRAARVIVCQNRLATVMEGKYGCLRHLRNLNVANHAQRSKVGEKRRGIFKKTSSWRSSHISIRTMIQIKSLYSPYYFLLFYKLFLVLCSFCTHLRWLAYRVEADDKSSIIAMPKSMPTHHNSHKDCIVDPSAPLPKSSVPNIEPIICPSHLSQCSSRKLAHEEGLRRPKNKKLTHLSLTPTCHANSRKQDERDIPARAGPTETPETPLSFSHDISWKSLNFCSPLLTNPIPRQKRPN